MMPLRRPRIAGDRAWETSFAGRFVASVAMVVGMFALLVAASYPVMALTVVGATMTGFVVEHLHTVYEIMYSKLINHVVLY